MRDDVQEAGVLRNVARHREEREEDRHLQEHGEAATKRVEVMLRLELAHLLVHAYRIVLVLVLDLLQQRLKCLHARGACRRLGHQRHDEQSDDDGQDDDGDAPVPAGVCEEGQDLRQKVNKPIPHGASVPLLLTERGRIPPHGTGDSGQYA